MNVSQCHRVFRVIGEALNLPIGSVEVLEKVARAVVEEFGLKGCHFRLLSRDEKVLEHVASFGLSDRFLNKGPVDAETAPRTRGSSTARSSRRRASRRC
jgi:hypothetical protein